MASLLLCLVVSGLPSSIILSSNGGDNLAIFKDTGVRSQETPRLRDSETGDYFYLFSPHPTSPLPHFPTSPLPHTPHPTPHTPLPTPSPAQLT
ncbi:MAG: hypothetical protein EWV41_20720 [Microcystis wesenbergii Mw_MB_S_20031200_S109]|uniref:Uncharacterized protein n=1 Tax=Microcystis wesenbergii Mw_MB_S_20031200_S109D TaxID=2486241 RepID=A0A552LZK2_9CHRO|nr:MAG: hypothetical protein EWV41_20720 [Microcystis wesenbergii Mw_MB_S_20031200_S109]TRV25642.1 MAG: hypothetical protein EWV88_07605 [Microcystis wesenbergii Mw_MB_S_20031200_S109D]